MKKFISMVTMIMMLGLLMAGCGNSASNDGQQLKGNIATNGSLHNAKIEVDSIIGEGTLITVKF